MPCRHPQLSCVHGAGSRSEGSRRLESLRKAASSLVWLARMRGWVRLQHFAPRRICIALPHYPSHPLDPASSPRPLGALARFGITSTTPKSSISPATPEGVKLGQNLLQKCPRLEPDPPHNMSLTDPASGRHDSLMWSMGRSASAHVGVDSRIGSGKAAGKRRPAHSLLPRVAWVRRMLVIVVHGDAVGVVLLARDRSV